MINPWTDPQLDQIIAALDAAGVPPMAGRTVLRAQWLVEAWQHAQQRATLITEIAAKQTDAIGELHMRIACLRREIDRRGGDSAELLLGLRDEPR